MNAGARCLLDSLMLISEKKEKSMTHQNTIICGEDLNHHKSHGIEFVCFFVAGDETSLYLIT